MLKRLDPLVKLAVALAWIGASVLVFDPRFQIAAILLAGGALLLLNRTSPLLLAALMVPFCLFGFGFLTTSLLFRRESDFALAMSAEALVASPAFSAGVTLFLRAVACGMVSTFFALTTDPGALVRALMARCRLPPRVGYSLFTAMNLVPDLLSEARRIRLARAMRRGRPPRRFPGPAELTGLIIPLLAFAIRRASRAAIAMEARGLARDAPRTIANVPYPGRPDAIFATLSLGLLATCIWLAG